MIIVFLVFSLVCVGNYAYQSAYIGKKINGRFSIKEILPVLTMSLVYIVAIALMIKLKCMQGVATIASMVATGFFLFQSLRAENKEIVSITDKNTGRKIIENRYVPESKLKEYRDNKTRYDIEQKKFVSYRHELKAMLSIAAMFACGWISSRLSFDDASHLSGTEVFINLILPVLLLVGVWLFQKTARGDFGFVKRIKELFKDDNDEEG